MLAKSNRRVNTGRVCRSDTRFRRKEWEYVFPRGKKPTFIGSSVTLSFQPFTFLAEQQVEEEKEK